MKLRTGILFLVTLGCSGCATIGSHDPQGLSSDVNSGVYRGVREDWYALAHPGCMGGIGAPVYCLDMPFSFIADTLWLPADAVTATEKPKSEEPKTK